MRYPAVLLAAVVVLLLLATPAIAVTVHVDVKNDEDDGSCVHPDCSLREAVKYAPVGATVDVPAGDYPLASELQVPRTMTIDGAGAGSTTIRATGAYRVIHDLAGPVTIRDVKVTGGGDTNGFGGGIMDQSTEPLTLDRVRITENEVNLDFGGSATNDGGAGVATNGPVTVRRSVIDNNSANLQTDDSLTASGGGGIWVGEGKLTVTDSEIRDNRASISGARVADEDVTGDGGGGIHHAGEPGGSLTLTRSTVAGNGFTAEGQTKVNDNGGGGIYAHGVQVTVVNSTLSDNGVTVPTLHIDNGGGGIFTDDATASLVNATISDNGASSAGMDAGGALYREGGSVSARNTIIAHNVADSGANCFGSISSQGRNIEDRNTCGLTGPGDKRSTPIALGALTFNGGPTRTRAIFAGGPAFNTATNCPATDQRGVHRPAGARCDVGAFELQVPTAVTGATKRVRTTSARLLGSVNPNGKATTYLFQYGKTKAYGSKTAVKPTGAGAVSKPASGGAKGLKPATIYHYRLVATNAFGTTRGRDRSFITHMTMPSGCVKDRRLTVPLGRPKGSKVVTAIASVGGKQVGAAGGTDVKRMKLTGLPAKPFRLKVVATLGNGRKVLGSRRYKPC